MQSPASTRFLSCGGWHRDKASFGHDCALFPAVHRVGSPKYTNHSMSKQAGFKWVPVELVIVTHTHRRWQEAWSHLVHRIDLQEEVTLISFC